MIEKIHIQNFKSIYDLEIEVGRVNVFIGENGSGKSNLLEALVFVSASESNMLSNEFLFPRGMRVPEPELMRSAFFEEDREKDIHINIELNGNIIKEFEFKNSNTEYSKWIEIENDTSIIMKMILENRPSQNTKGLDKRTLEYLKQLEEKDILRYEKMEKNKLTNFIIYSPEHEELRNFADEGQIQPLGVKGEGLYKLLKVVNNYEDKIKKQ